MLNCFLKFYLFCNWVIKSKESWVLCAECADLTERLQCKHKFPEFAHGREYLTCKAGCQHQVEMPEESTFKAFSSLQFWLLPIRNTILSQMLHDQFIRHLYQTKFSDFFPLDNKVCQQATVTDMYSMACNSEHGALRGIIQL